MRTIQVRIHNPTDSRTLVHQLRNYGEDVYRHIRDSGKGFGEVNLDEVDSATDQFSVCRVANSKVRRVRIWLEEEGARQHLLVTTELM